jgi:hypothetical protein
MAPGDGMEWLEFLRAEDARCGRADVLARLRTASGDGFPSAPTLSQVIGGKYPANAKRLQALVEGALMGQTVQCPALGTDIPRNTCLDNQKRSFAATNPARVALQQACKTCPNRRRS